MSETWRQHKQYLLTGVSHAVPFIACGGILIASAIAGSTFLGHGTDTTKVAMLKLMGTIGEAAFTLALPVLAGYIAYAMAGKPGLVPGFIAGFVTTMPFPVMVNGAASTTKAGFLAAIVGGLLAGHLVSLMKKIPVHRLIRPVMPIIVIPVVSGLGIGLVMMTVIGQPFALLMATLSSWLTTMGHGNALVLACVLGAMIAFDMGGPINKAAFFFASAMIAEGNIRIMGCVAAAICTPPLGLGLATLINRKQWSEEQRESGLAALGMGMIGITEGAIPFAAADPFRVIPSIMLGSMVAATIAMLANVGDNAPHGGPIVLPVVDGRLMYVVAILIGTLTTALTINFVKRLTEEPAPASTKKNP
jgi:fructose-specific phosphotransferase system IIC component